LFLTIRSLKTNGKGYGALNRGIAEKCDIILCRLLQLTEKDTHVRVKFRKRPSALALLSFSPPCW
jgi:hypothetical protein